MLMNIRKQSRRFCSGHQRETEMFLFFFKPGTRLEQVKSFSYVCMPLVSGILVVYLYF